MRLSAIPDLEAGSLNLHWRPWKRPTSGDRATRFQPRRWDPVVTHHLSSHYEQGFRMDNTVRVGGEYLLSGSQPPRSRTAEDHLGDRRDARGQIKPSWNYCGRTWPVTAGPSFGQTFPGTMTKSGKEMSKRSPPIKTMITNVCFQEPGRTKAVYLIGHVPIPYAGFTTRMAGGRALPADLYYGDLDGIYTDSSVHFRSFLEGSASLAHDNLRGDGKFDRY